MISPLSASERDSSKRLELTAYPAGAPVGWDNAAYYGTTDFFDAQRDTFVVKLTAGATYDVFSTSTYDPHTLAVHDANGDAVAWDIDPAHLNFGEDVVFGFRATYTGDHYISASWSYGLSSVLGFIEIYEDVDTIPPPWFVYGTAGNDVLRDGPASQGFEGGPGYDAFEVSNTGRRNATVQAQAGGGLFVQHGGQTDALAGIEEVRFADGRLVFDPSDAAAQVVRLYQAALGREPDQGGLNAWTAALKAGAPLEGLARGFLASTEFAIRMGTDLSDGALVTRLYENVLHRAPDQGGYDHWTGALQGGMTRAQALAGFSESAENKQNTAPVVAAGIWDLSETAAQIARLYDTVLNRLPDVGGLAGWRDAIDSGGASLKAVAGSFAASAEFQTRYGTLDDAGFVTALYRNTLHRDPDAPGLAAWTGALAQGAARSDVVLGFSESAEHKASTAQHIMSEDPASFGILFA